jgi:hypothetical protein
MSTLPAATAKPDIVAINDLLDSVFSGEYRIPRFQRPYIWAPDDMLKLFDSVARGYPIGSLLIWQTERKNISSLSSIGPIILPSKGPTVKSYVVDGHQRLATLLGVLRLPEDHPREKMEDWRWWIVYDLIEEQFVHLKDPSPEVPLHLLPLRSLLRTVDFARRTRELASSKMYSEEQINIFLDRADSIQRSIREYRLPMTVMKSGSLDDAVNIFARVNQRGRDMTPDQMVSALTFRDESEGDFDLARSIDDILGELRADGFGDLPRRVVLQVILALADLDFTRPSYENIVNRSSYERMIPAVQNAKDALVKSVKFLNKRVGLKTSRLLPYASTIVMLSIYLNETVKTRGDQHTSDKGLLEKWFWATSFNGWFAGANTTDLRKAGDVMRRLANRQKNSVSEFIEFFFARSIRPFPESFDRRSARVRASLLVQINIGKPLDPVSGKPIDGFAVFASDSARDIPYFYPNLKRPAVSNPANRVILPEGYPRNARVEFLKALENNSAPEKFLNSHFITREGYKALRDDRREQFINLREKEILRVEQEFLSQYQLHLDETATRNEEEIDIEGY